MKRYLFNLLTMLSLLLCVAMIGLCVRSFWCSEELLFRNDVDNDSFHTQDLIGVVNGYGGWGIAYSWARAGSPPAASTWHFEYAREKRNPWMQSNIRERKHAWLFLDCGYGYDTEKVKKFPGSFGLQFLVVPHWFAILASTIPPLLWMRQWRKRRQLTGAFLCHECGYDLRATPDRCPECRTPRSA